MILLLPLIFTAPLPLQEAEPVAKSTHVFGRVMSDFTLSDGADGSGKGAEFRRVRLGVKGDLSAFASYKVELEFAAGDEDDFNGGGPVEGDADAIFADVYLKLDRLFPASLTIGHFKEPMGLDELTSSRFITFMERSVTSGFSPARNHGFMLSESSDELTWQAGYFYDADAYGTGSDADATSLAGRVVYRPWFSNRGESLLHLGAAWNARQGTKTIKFYPGTHAAPSSESFILTDPSTLGLEIAWASGPLSFTAEQMSAEDGITRNTASATSLQASWFMGHQHRGYKTSSAAFERAQGADGGAWELAIRHGSWDFDDTGENDSGSALALGLNWYFDSYTRLMLDSTQVAPEGQEAFNVLAIRFAYDF